MTDQEPQGTPRWGAPPPTPPPSRPEEPARPPWLGPPPSPPPLAGPPPQAGPPPPPGPSPAQGSPGGSWWRAALVGGLVGALVATAISAAVVLADDDHSTTREAAAAPAVAGSNLELRGQPLDVQGVLQAVQDGVVSIRTEVQQQGVFGTQTGQAAGSGMIIDESGLVLTNAHVVRGATSIKVNPRNGASLDGDVVGAIRAADIALVHIDPANQQLKPVRLGSSDALRV